MDSLPESIRLTEGEANLFLVERVQGAGAGARVFLSVLLPGDLCSPEPGVSHGNAEYALAMVACGLVRAESAAPEPALWLERIREGVSAVAQTRVQGDSVADLLVSLIEAEQAKKQQRHARQEKNRLLTDSAVYRKLDELGTLGGVKSAKGEAKEGAREGADPLELALRRIAQDYRLQICDKDLGELRANTALPCRERTQNFAVSANWRMRMVHLPPDWRKLSGLPLLVFYEDSGTPLVVYLKAGGGTYWDPVLGGEPRPLAAALAERLSPEAYCFYEPFPPGKIQRKTLLRYVFATARNALATIFCIGLVSALIGLVMPVATQYVTGKIIPTGNLPELWQLAALLVVLTACQISLGVVPTLVMLLFGTQQYERFQAAMFDYILRIPVAAFKTCDSGDMTHRILGASQVQETVFNIISGQFLGSVFSLISLGMMFYYSPILAGVGACIVFFYAVSFFLLSRINLRPLATQVAVSGRISGLMKQFFDGMTKIRGAGAEQQVISRFLDDFSLLSRNGFVIQRNSAVLNVVMALFPMLITVLFYGLAGGGAGKKSAPADFSGLYGRLSKLSERTPGPFFRLLVPAGY
ncbi:ABC transporter ATP-binding protein [Desulfovibrio sp. OttesenSCG-928-G15]|nr:ABC transporter ATP-binding protein [Desulfovibrio sp. OttesenSCG-928-G15]